MNDEEGQTSMTSLDGDEMSQSSADSSSLYNFNSQTASSKGMLGSDTSLDEENNIKKLSDNNKDRRSPIKKRRSKDSRICKVCGDKALGYNFNAMTCESCKAFFRRNALKESTLACLFESNCSIDIRTRRFCPHCRLAKCYDVGMKKEMILDDDSRKARMQKVMQNRTRKGSKQPDPMLHLIKEEPIDADMLPDQSDSSRADHTEDSILDVEQSMLTVERGAILQEIDRSLSANGFDDILDPEFTDKDPALFRQVTAAEHGLFKNLGAVYTATLGDMLSDVNPMEQRYNSCSDLINNSTIAVRKLIKYIKKLEDFQQLPTDDQLTMLKSCILSAILLRSAWFYDIENEGWMTPTGCISAKILKNAVGYSEVYEAHIGFCKRVKTLFEDDSRLFSLVQMLCIFSPINTELKVKPEVANLQDKYLILLKHYLEWKFSYIQCAAVFTQIINLISEMKNLSDVHYAIILRANPSEIEPLMLEVFNLKKPLTA